MARALCERCGQWYWEHTPPNLCPLAPRRARTERARSHRPARTLFGAVKVGWP